MSERIGRYRQVYPRLWRHPGFVGLTKSSQQLTLYLLSGPQTNAIGLYHLSVATAAEDLNVAVETVRKGLADVTVTFGWTFDAVAKVFFIPSWWRWNPPANANVLKGNLKALNEIPPCGLTEAFARNLETLPETLHVTFVEGCTQRMAKRSPIQEQDQDQEQEQEQERRASRGESAAAKGHSQDGSARTQALIAVARDVFQFVSTNGDLEGQIDTFHQIRRTHKQAFVIGEPKRDEILSALNVVRSERRQAGAA